MRFKLFTFPSFNLIRGTFPLPGTLCFAVAFVVVVVVIAGAAIALFACLPQPSGTNLRPLASSSSCGNSEFA